LTPGLLGLPPHFIGFGRSEGRRLGHETGILDLTKHEQYSYIQNMNTVHIISLSQRILSHASRSNPF
jgi:hypothetical protein